MKRVAVSSVQVSLDGVDHLTGEGASGAGGSVLGAKILCVSCKTEGAKLGGIRKCNVSSLSSKS